jgi:putative oligomerization/nucleic acid binding protein
MGLFKDMRNIREVGAARGGMPNMRDVRKDIHGIFDDRGETEILKTGIIAKGIVRGFPQVIQGDRFAMQIPIEVHPPQGDPYTVNYVFPTVRMQAAIVAGMEVPIKISRDDPQRIAVQWDAQMAEIAAAGGTQAAVMDGLAKTYGGAANAAMEQAMKNLRDGTGGNPPPTTYAPDIQSRIEKLEELKAAGLIDDAQYAAKKQTLIDQL